MNDRFGTADELGHRVAQIAAGDPQSTRLVYALVIALIVVGLLLVLLAVWMIRRTKADLELLGPLERMGDSKWRKRDPQRRQALLDEVRPVGAERPTPATASIPPDPAALPAAVEFPPPAAPAEPVVEAEPEPVVEAEPEPVAEIEIRSGVELGDRSRSRSSETPNPEPVVGRRPRAGRGDRRRVDHRVRDRSTG